MRANRLGVVEIIDFFRSSISIRNRSDSWMKEKVRMLGLAIDCILYYDVHKRDMSIVIVCIIVCLVSKDQQG